MIPSLHNGVSALKSLTQGLQVLGNNIANVNSLGYKSARANYSDNFYMHLNDAETGVDGDPSNNIQQHGTGVHVGSISTDFNQGTHETTGLDLDLAIQGEALPNGGGFFEIVDPVSEEIFYTRAGAFESTKEGLVVTRDQYRYQLPLLLEYIQHHLVYNSSHHLTHRHHHSGLNFHKNLQWLCQKLLLHMELKCLMVYI